MKEDDGVQSKISENLIFDLQINFKRVVNEIIAKPIDKILTQTIHLLNSLLHGIIEIYHYIQYDTFSILNNQNPSYERNVWENVYDMEEYFKDKILLGVEKLVNIKVRIKFKLVYCLWD